MARKDGETINVREYGAIGVAEKAETQVCPARVHAGWNPEAELRRDIYRAPRDKPDARDTGGLQAAIDAVSERGGGTVLVPPGDYLTGPLWLCSDIHLHLESGARLWGSPEISDYETEDIFSDKTHGQKYLTGQARNVALINAANENNITISGPGQISGQGGAYFIPWWRADKSYTLQRPWRLFSLNGCKEVTVRDLNVKDSCSWTLVFQDCCHVRVSGVRIDCVHGPNADGIDIENSQFVTISDCDVFTTDDGICLKSTHPDGVVRNITVSNCNVRTLCNGFKIGTETLGIVEDVVFSNCTAYNLSSDPVNMAAAIAVGCCDGAKVERVQFQNIAANQCKAAFYMHLGKRTSKQAPYRDSRIGSLEGITISNLRAAGCIMPSFICGHKDVPIKDVILRDVRISGSFVCESDPAEIDVPELPEGYPDTRMYGDLPCYGLFIRNAENIVQNNLQVKNQNPADSRQMIKAITY